MWWWNEVGKLDEFLWEWAYFCRPWWQFHRMLESCSPILEYAGNPVEHAGTLPNMWLTSSLVEDRHVCYSSREKWL
jgi:hypothetical protein